MMGCLDFVSTWRAPPNSMKEVRGAPLRRISRRLSRMSSALTMRSCFPCLVAEPRPPACRDSVPVGEMVPLSGGSAILRELEFGVKGGSRVHAGGREPAGVCLERALSLVHFASRTRIWADSRIVRAFSGIVRYNPGVFLTITESYTRGGQGRHGADRFPEGDLVRSRHECHGGVIRIWASVLSE